MKKLYWLFVLCCLLIVSCQSFPDLSVPEYIDLNSYWKFNTGDDLQWKEPDFNDKQWDSIHVNKTWEKQGVENYEGYAWYRKKFRLPSVMKVNAFCKDSVKIIIGRINGADQTYLNGRLLGQNNKTLPLKKKIITSRFETKAIKNTPRVYTISVKDQRLSWDKENCISIRVFSDDRNGGLQGLQPSLSIADIKDYLHMDIVSSPFQIKQRSKISKLIQFTNLSSSYTFSGIYSIEVIREGNKEIVYQSKGKVSLQPDAKKTLSWDTDLDLTKVFLVRYTFQQNDALRDVSVIQEIPYFLTPPSKKEPVIHGPEIYGARPGSEFIYKIPTSGIEPLTFAVEKLPDGLGLDVVRGIITGSIETPGDYMVILKAENIHGIAEKWFTIKISDTIALTPPMGWNSRFCSTGNINKDTIKSAADHFILLEMADHGWTYITIDNEWQATKRNYQGILTEKDNFKELNDIVDYIHNKGLKTGIFSYAGDELCGNVPGSWGFENIDAQFFANKRFDFLKYEWCPGDIDTNQNHEEYRKAFTTMKKALEAQKRDIVYQICADWPDGVTTKTGNSGGNIVGKACSRIESWEDICEYGFDMIKSNNNFMPGSFYNPGMLSLGMMNFNGQMKPPQLTINEQYSQISLWAMLSAPLFISCNLKQMDEFTLSLLTNNEVIAIQQNTSGKKALKKIEKNELVVMVRELQSHKKVIGVFNLDKIKRKISLDWEELHFDGKYLVRDAWRQKDVGVFSHSLQVEVFPHGVKLYYFMKQD